MAASRPTGVDGVVRAIASGDDIAEAAWAEGDPVLDELKVIYEIGRLGRDVAADEQSADASVGTPPPDSVGPGSGRWAQFHLLEQVGQGVYGTVFRAWDVARRTFRSRAAAAPRRRTSGTINFRNRSVSFSA